MAGNVTDAQKSVFSTTSTVTANSTTRGNNTVSDTIGQLKIPLFALGSLLSFIVLLLVIGGCIHLIQLVHQKHKRRQRNLGCNTFSAFDIARIFNDDPDSYAALRTENATRVVHGGSDPLSCRETHSYAELKLADLDPDYDISEEQINTEDSRKEVELTVNTSKPEPPRKCNTLSGILMTRLAVGWRRNDRSTLNRYLTTRRESSTSSNDYVDNGLEDIRSKPLPHVRDMSSKDADEYKDSFVPEDDNLWERCSSDGSLEHDITLRPPSDAPNARHAVMSDLLRSSWVDIPPLSLDQDYCNNPMTKSRSSLGGVDGVFIPEGGSDHPLQEEGVQNIQQMSQNIIDLISENFSSKVQLRESELYQQNIDISSAPLHQATRTKDPFIAQYFSELQPSAPSEAPKPTLPVKRIQSVSPVDIEESYQSTPSKTLASETLPRMEKRRLPPVPQKTKQMVLEHKAALKPPSLQSQVCIPKRENEKTTFCPDQHTGTLSNSHQRFGKVITEHKASLKPSSPPSEVCVPKNQNNTSTPFHDQGTRITPNTTTVSSPSTAQEGNYENLRGKMCPMPLASGQVVKHLPPAPPPKHCKPQLQVSTDSSDSGLNSNAESTSPSTCVLESSPPTTNFLKVTRQLQQTLAMRMPGQLTSKRADISPSEADTSQDY